MTTTDADSTAPPESFADKDIHFVLRVAQGALASSFLVMGAVMVASPMADVARGLPFVAGTTKAVIHAVGIAEIVLALGVVLPQAARIKVRLATLAALFLAISMVFAVVVHVIRGELVVALLALELGAIAGVVAWGHPHKVQVVPTHFFRRHGRARLVRRRLVSGHHHATAQ